MKPKLNIAVISPEYPPSTNWGGIARLNENISQLFSTVGHHVHVLTSNQNDHRGKIVKLSDHITVHYIPFVTSSRLFNALYYKFFLFTFSRKLLKKTFPILFNIVEWNLFCLLYMFSLRTTITFSVAHAPIYYCPTLFVNIFFPHIKYVFHLQGPQELLNKYEKPSIENNIKARLESWYSIKFSDVVIICSQELLIDAKKHFPGYKNKLIFIPNFLDTAKYHNHTKFHTNNIIYMGRLEYRKGVDILIDSFIKLSKKYHSIKLYLIGKNGWGFYKNNNYVDFHTYYADKKISHNIKKRILIFPRIDDNNSLIDFLKSIKGIGVFPSRDEPFGFVYIETMALGYIVIGSNRGGAKEIISNGKSGYLCFPKQNELARTLEHAILLNSDERNLLKMNAKKIVRQKYGFGAALSQYRKVYKDFLNINL